MDKEIKSIIIATLIFCAMYAGAATIENTQILTSPLRGSDKVPAGRTGQSTANTATADQIADFSHNKYSSAENARMRNMSTQIDSKQAALSNAATLGKITESGNLPLWNGSTWPGGAGSATWGGISGTLSAQTDLQSALDGKSATTHNHTGTYEAANGNIQTHIGTTDTPHVTAGEKSTWSGKQDALGYTPVPNTRTVAGKALTADVTLAKGDVGLGNVDNTSDANKPVSSATQTALDGKASTSHTQAMSTVTGLTAKLTNHSTAIKASYKRDDNVKFGTMSAARVTADEIKVPQGVLSQLIELFTRAAQGAYKVIIAVSDTLTSTVTYVFGNDGIRKDGVLMPTREEFTNLSTAVAGWSGGAGEVSNVRFANESAARHAHSINTSNPHSTTAAQVGAPSLAVFNGHTSAFKAHRGAGGAEHALATISTPGFMSAADKVSLASLEDAAGTTISVAALGGVCNGTWQSLQTRGYTLSSAKAAFTNMSSQITNIATQSADWAAMGEAMAIAKTTGGKVLFPKGSCRPEAPTVIKSQSSFVIEGEGQGNSYIHSKDGADIVIFDVQETGTYGQKGPKFRRMSISSTPTSYSVTAQSDLKGTGIRIGGTSLSSPKCDAAADDRLIFETSIEDVDFEWLQKGIEFNTSQFANIHNNYFFINNYGLYGRGNACDDWGDNYIYDNNFQGAHLDNGFSAITEAHIYQTGAGGSRVYNNKFLASNYAFKWLGATGAGTSILLLNGNSYEQQRNTSVDIQKGSADALSFVLINGGEFARIGGGDGIKAITIDGVEKLTLTGAGITGYSALYTASEAAVNITHSQHGSITGNVVDCPTVNNKAFNIGSTNSDISYGANSVACAGGEFLAEPTTITPSTYYTGTGAAKVLYSGANGKVLEATNLYYDNTNSEVEIYGKLAIGTSTPGTTAEIYSTTANPQMRIRDEVTNATAGGGMILYHNNATNGLPTIGDRLGYFLFGGYDSTNARNAALIGSYAPLSWSAGASWPAELRFETVETNSRLERMKIMHNGNITTGTGQTVGRKMITTYGGNAVLFQNISAMGKGRLVQRDYARDNYVRVTRGGAAVGNLVAFGAVLGGYSSVGVATTCKAGGYCWIVTEGRGQAYVNAATNCGTESAFVYALGSGSGVAACDATNHADAAYHNAEVGMPLTSTATSNLIDVMFHFNCVIPATGTMFAAFDRRRRRKSHKYWGKVLRK